MAWLGYLLTVCSTALLLTYSKDPVEKNPRKKPVQQNHRAGSSVGEEVDSTLYELNVKHLSDELAKEKPSRKTVRSLMKETFRGRRRWVLTDSPPVMDYALCACRLTY